MTPPHEKQHHVDDVYGLSRDVPMNYVIRPSVDGAFIDELSRKRHIVVYGGSKQGKTCLRKSCLQDSDYIVVQCSNKWSLDELHSAILKEVGFELTMTSELATSGKKKVSASASAGLLGAKLKAAGETEDEVAMRTVSQPLALDLADVNDVIRALGTVSFSRYIVLEDFHYLNRDTQKDFAVALKAFHERSQIIFIVVGVWLEENRLIVFNGDLTGRVIALNADSWSPAELSEVISGGSALLNVTFDDAFQKALIDASEESVYIVQECCRKACMEAEAYTTTSTNQLVGTGVDVKSLVRSVVNQQNGRYMSFLNEFARGFQDTDLEMYKWLLYPILTTRSSDLRHGLSYRYIRQSIESRHPRGVDLNPGNLTQALLNAASLQIKKGVTPLVFDYDESNLKLSVVDRGFPIWLRYQSRSQLLEAVGLPSDPDEQMTFDDEH
jgi:hypothetical protein